MTVIQMVLIQTDFVLRWQAYYLIQVSAYKSVSITLVLIALNQVCFSVFDEFDRRKSQPVIKYFLRALSTADIVNNFSNFFKRNLNQCVKYLPQLLLVSYCLSRSKKMQYLLFQVKLNMNTITVHQVNETSLELGLVICQCASLRLFFI